MEEYLEAIERNSTDRQNWKEILGQSLTKFVAESYGQGKQKEEIVKKIMELWERKMTFTNPNALMNRGRIEEIVRIGTSARIGEMQSERSALKKGLAQVHKYNARVRTFQNGDKYIYISPNLDIQEGDLIQVQIVKMKVE